MKSVEGILKKVIIWLIFGDLSACLPAVPLLLGPWKH